jgi:hypothetical protein
MPLVGAVPAEQGVELGGDGVGINPGVGVPGWEVEGGEGAAQGAEQFGALGAEGVGGGYGFWSPWWG